MIQGFGLKNPYVLSIISPKELYTLALDLESEGEIKLEPVKERRESV